MKVFGYLDFQFYSITHGSPVTDNMAEPVSKSPGNNRNGKQKDNQACLNPGTGIFTDLSNPSLKSSGICLHEIQFHPFSPVMTIPSTTYFWQRMYTNIKGNEATLRRTIT